MGKEWPPGGALEDAAQHLTIGAAARELGCSEASVRRMVDTGKLNGIRTPYGRLVSAASVAAYKQAKDEMKK